MPAYEYRCSKCDTSFTTRHSYKNRLYDCLECGGINTLTKIISRVNYSKKTLNKGKKVGTEVVNSIEEAKKELELHKKSLQKKSTK
jgi:putative FmdB family regulatory protein